MSFGDQASLFPDGPNGLHLPELWLQQEGPEADVVVSTRMRLARNVEGFHFKSRFKEGESERLEAYLREVLLEAEPRFRYHSMPALSSTEREVMFERHLVSREHVGDEQPRGVAFAPDGRTSVMVNEEDHLRIQAFAPGFDLESVDQRVNALDDDVAGRVRYCFDARFGYRTSCPTNTGTGLRTSVMMHLPALALRPAGNTKGRDRDLVRMRNAAEELGLTVRGLFGESSRAEGDFFQISNQVTLGRSPAQTLQDVRELVKLVVEWERSNREAHLRDDPGRLDDHVWRAWGLLTHARRLSSSEALSHLSALRLGAQLDIFHEVRTPVIQSLMVNLRPAHLQLRAERELEPDERDELRARLIRDALGSSTR
ncbi:MAG: protein-arginine kinase [Planctomycetota bacterium]|nr:MAG: protein-arginine kinase [Planctomycetota bacterium]